MKLGQDRLAGGDHAISARAIARGKAHMLHPVVQADMFGPDVGLQALDMR